MYKILIVEDRKNLRRQWVRLLKQSGYDVLEAGDGQEAVDLAQRMAPHLIIMDMGLPVLDGYQATEQIKKNPETQHIPIIALTGEVVDREKVFSIGCDAFLQKPAPALSLLAKIQTLLDACRNEQME